MAFVSCRQGAIFPDGSIVIYCIIGPYETILPISHPPSMATLSLSTLVTESSLPRASLAQLTPVLRTATRHCPG